MMDLVAQLKAFRSDRPDEFIRLAEKLTDGRDALQARIDGGIRLYATQGTIKYVVAFLYPENYRNATLLLDEGGELCR